jgi:hypothetical protein
VGGHPSTFILPQPPLRLRHQPPRPILPVQPLPLLLQHPERLPGEVQRRPLRQQVRPRAGQFFTGIQDVFELALAEALRIKDVAQLLAVWAVEPDIVGVGRDLDPGPALVEWG